VSVPPLCVIRPGTVEYRTALAWQRELAAARIAGRTAHDTLLLLEHPPVVTLGRAGQAGHILDAQGIDVVEVERGGDATFHGPGQLVGYPILDLRQHRPDVHWYLRALEQVLIDALTTFGIAATRRSGYTGVWTRGRKIASIGIHVKQWVTWHGFALNVTTDVDEFARVVPCGIANVIMTSMADETADEIQTAADRMKRAAAAVVAAFAQVFGVTALETVAPALTYGASVPAGPALT
jgi:lipoyl(octanoyl) transferase